MHCRIVQSSIHFSHSISESLSVFLCLTWENWPCVCFLQLSHRCTHNRDIFDMTNFTFNSVSSNSILFFCSFHIFFFFLPFLTVSFVVCNYKVHIQHFHNTEPNGQFSNRQILRRLFASLFIFLLFYFHVRILSIFFLPVVIIID